MLMSIYKNEGKEQMHTCLKVCIEHTCLHIDDYDVHNASDMPHVREELAHVIHHIKHIQRNLMYADYNDENLGIWNDLDSIIHIISKLSKDLRNPENNSVEHYKKLIGCAREKLHKIIDEMVDKRIITPNKDFYKIND